MSEEKPSSYTHFESKNENIVNAVYDSENQPFAYQQRRRNELSGQKENEALSPYKQKLKVRSVHSNHTRRKGLKTTNSR